MILSCGGKFSENIYGDRVDVSVRFCVSRGLLEILEIILMVGFFYDGFC